MRKIAVTGSLSSGKTTVCQVFKELGAYVVSADTIVHELLDSDSIVGQQIITLLGSQIITDGHLNRKKIRDLVFSHPEKLKGLEEILHPAVFEKIEAHYKRQQEKNPQPTLFLAEIPLFYEAKQTPNYDAVICVTADPLTCRKRFVIDEKSSSEEFDKRMNRQLPLEEKVKRSQFVIKNNGNLKELKEEIKKMHALLTAK